MCSCVAWMGLGLTMHAKPCRFFVETGAVAQGTESNLSLGLVNEIAISGGQFTVTLPQGITIKNVALNDERSNGHTIEYRLNETSNSAMILFYAQPTAPLKGNDGSLCTLTIEAVADMSSGEYKVALADVNLAADAVTSVDATVSDGTLMVTSRYLVTVAATEGGTVEGEGLYNAGDTVTVSAVPNIGYHFVKWSDGCTDNPYKFKATENIHLTAEFMPNTYTVVYVVDGEEYMRKEVVFGDTIAEVEEPVKEGHTFSGWSEAPETMPANDITISGTFTVNSYTVTYILDGEVFKTETVAYGTVIPTPEVPAKEGYNFSGWGDVPATMPARDLTLTGSYTINKDMKYDLIYMIDGVEYKRVTLSFGDAIVLEESPTKEGHTFSGWSEVPGTMPLHDVVVSGSFTANSYTVTYVLDGEVFKTETVVFGTVITTPDAPVKEGHTFSGWSEAPETMPANDITISGTFIINKYLVTFKIGDEVIAADSLEYGATIVAPEAPEKEGYTFNGWEDVAETVPASDVTYEGSYTVNIYKVYYYVGDELVHTAEIAYGEAIPEYVYEPEEGYTFLGWVGETYEAMPAHDVTYTANIESGVSLSILDPQRSVIYDLTGRKVIYAENLKGGIYIVNGRKVVIK